jgi:hypothetical protein
LLCAALSVATNLRVLSLGYLPDIPPALRAACEQSNSLCYAGAYTGSDPILLRNGLVPHPLCWSAATTPHAYFEGENATSIIDRIPTPKCQSDIRCALRAIFIKNSLGHGIKVYTWRDKHPIEYGKLFSSDCFVLCARYMPTFNYNRSALAYRHISASNGLTLNTAFPNRSFHGTTLCNAMSIARTEKLLLNNGKCFTSPNPLYALHPAFAVPYSINAGVAVQALVEVRTTAGRTPVSVQAATVSCCLPGSDSIEWVHAEPPEVMFVWLFVYARNA